MDRFRGYRFRWVHLLFLFVWTLLVLYPNPYRLIASIGRTIHPPLAPDAVADLVDGELALVLDDPRAVEQFVLQRFPYQYDWETYRVPWYFPSVEEALERKTGDCKTRFVVLASLFEHLEIPYQKTLSLTHFWVVYEGKEEAGIERTELAWVIRDDEGVRFQRPGESARDVWDAFRKAFWDPMPFERKVLFLLGPVLMVGLGTIPFRRSILKGSR